MDAERQNLLVLVYESTLETRNSGYGEMMVFSSPDAAEYAVSELAKIGVFVQSVPLFPVERLKVSK